MQAVPGAQSALVVHDAAHERPSAAQAKGEQSMASVLPTQLPIPLHVGAVARNPPLQAVLPHVVVSPGKKHLPAFCPSHLPPQRPELPQGGRAPWGGPEMALQVPVLRGSSHASHSPAHARLQHNPSTQKPLVH
jgi:hypothetical protein